MPNNIITPYIIIYYYTTYDWPARHFSPNRRPGLRTIRVCWERRRSKSRGERVPCWPSTFLAARSASPSCRPPSLRTNTSCSWPPGRKPVRPCRNWDSWRRWTLSAAVDARGRCRFRCDGDGDGDDGRRCRARDSLPSRSARAPTPRPSTWRKSPGTWWTRPAGRPSGCQRSACCRRSAAGRLPGPPATDARTWCTAVRRHRSSISAGAWCWRRPGPAAGCPTARTRTRAACRPRTTTLPGTPWPIFSTAPRMPGRPWLSWPPPPPPSSSPSRRTQVHTRYRTR